MKTKTKTILIALIVGILVTMFASAQEVKMQSSWSGAYSTVDSAAKGLIRTLFTTTSGDKHYIIYANRDASKYYIIRQRKRDGMYYKTKVEFTK